MVVSGKGVWHCESECDRGAGCGKTARPDLYGGLPAKVVPTISLECVLLKVPPRPTENIQVCPEVHLLVGHSRC